MSSVVALVKVRRLPTKIRSALWKNTSTVLQYLSNLSTVATPQDKIIEALEAEIIKLKTQLSDTEEKYQKMRKKFDELKIKMHGGGRK